MEQPLCLSCPEAARLVLLDPDLLEPGGSKAGDAPRYHQLLRLGGKADTANGNPYQHIWDLRNFTILLLRDRSYPFWERLFILGMFCKRLTEVTLAKQPVLVPQLLRDYAEIIEQGKLRSALDSIQVQSTPQLAAVLEVIHCHLRLTDPQTRAFGSV